MEYFIRGAVCFLISVEIFGMTELMLTLILYFDGPESLKLTKKTYFYIVSYSAGVGLWISLFRSGRGWLWMVSCGILAAYLMACTIMDYQTQEVYNFLHLFGGAAGAAVFLTNRPERDLLLSMLVFIAIQIVLFMKLYGVADGIVFIICALFEGIGRSTMLPFLLHMGAAFTLLGIVQAFRHNLNRFGNLKKEVPFLPYIISTVWFFI